jgi:hypothetical protein
VGSVLAGIGSMHWAYELLGGQKGPMNFLTRTMSYSLMFGLGYGLAFGPAFGVIAGVGLGVTLSLEHRRIVIHQQRFGTSPLNNAPSFGFIRGLIFGAASTASYGWRFGLWFGLISSIGLYILYLRRWSPTYDYRTHTRPVLTKRRLQASIYRGMVLGFSGAAAGMIVANEYVSIVLGVYVGAIAALISFLVGSFSPMIEFWADNLPGRTIAAAGVVIMLSGMALQSVQYFLVFFNIPIH